MFEVNCFYSGKDGFRRIHYLWVLRISDSGTALRGVIYDHTFALVSRRWLKVRKNSVSLRGSVVCCALASDSLFFSELDFVEDSACIPPEEVLDYFRNEKISP